ncbi:hypothetical protein PanWU01x14_282380 [Parasponia andersonii]|uniref:Uncharacterized protein n=1 Tax=Parasponia andersonii TaxID=3476 RepID=A0A2P5B0T2_PARAD|nr:hypothetical protein PanWU01x14_282380 [Parasponia andersonii]
MVAYLLRKRKINKAKQLTDKKKWKEHKIETKKLSESLWRVDDSER